MKKLREHYTDLGVNLDDITHPISKVFNDIKKAEELNSKLKEYYLKRLINSLDNIKEFDLKIYEFYKKRIAKNRDISIHGHIFEIINCSNLIRISKENNLNFKFGNTDNYEPDFLINDYGFEITSIRFSENTKKENPGKKLLNCFLKKNKKTYANKNNTLIININQPSFYNLKETKTIHKTYLKEREIIKKESNFGVVLYYMEYNEIINNEIKNFGTVYDDFSNNCSEELNIFLKKYILKEKYNVNKQNKIITPN